MVTCKVCPLTTTDVAAPLLRVAVRSDESNGLDHDSFVMIDKITTVRRANVATTVGRFDPATLLEVERRLLVFLGFAGSAQRHR